MSTPTRLGIAIILFSLAIFEMIYYSDIMHHPYMHMLVFTIGGTATLMILNAIDRIRKGI